MSEERSESLRRTDASKGWAEERAREIAEFWANGAMRAGVTVAVAQALREAEKRGREWMREEAAKECASWFDMFDFNSFDVEDRRRFANPNHIAERIRYLPLTDPAEGSADGGKG